jgi:hypothetical protein
VHSAGDFRDDLCCLPDRYRPAADYFVEMTSFDEPHTEVARAIAFADFVDGNDPRMIQLRCGFRFSAKTFQVRVSCPLTNANNL